MGYFLKSVMILLIFTYRKCKIRWRLACLLKEMIRTLMKHVFYKKLISLLPTEDHCLTFGLGCVWNANGGTRSCQNWSLYTVRAAVIPRVFNETWSVLTLQQKNLCTCDLCQHIPSNCITLDPKILERCWRFNHTFNIRGVSVSIFPPFFFFWTVSQKRTFLLLTLFSPEVSVSALLIRIFFHCPIYCWWHEESHCYYLWFLRGLRRESKDPILPMLLHWAEKCQARFFTTAEKYEISLNTCRIYVF